jgi:hypothetical protein
VKTFNWVHYTILVMALIVVLKVLADPPVVHQSTTRDTPGVVGQNTAGGFGVLGQSAQGPGMVGKVRMLWLPEANSKILGVEICCARGRLGLFVS